MGRGREGGRKKVNIFFAVIVFCSHSCRYYINVADTIQSILVDKLSVEMYLWLKIFHYVCNTVRETTPVARWAFLDVKET